MSILINCLLNFLLIIAFNLQQIYGANILALLGIASPSHHVWHSALTHALAERGHNLTILSPDLPKNNNIPKSAHYIHLEKVYKSMATSLDGKFDLKNFIGSGAIRNIPRLYDWGIKGCLGVIKSEGFYTLLNYPDNFKVDLIIHDFSLGACLLGFAHKFKYPPIVGASPFLFPPNTVDIVGGSLFPSYIPFYATSSYDMNMSFVERMHNTLIYTLDYIYRHYYAFPKINELIIHKYPKGTPYLSDIDKKTIIALVNSHPSINYPESLPPNIIEVGGLQIKEPLPLPTDLRDFIQKSNNSVILMSFGTNMQAKDVGLKLSKIILDTMKKMPEYNFIWKYEHDFDKKEMPSNVLIRKFVPQNDILAHSKTKAFITHCGGLSIQEATWHGVPIIGIPLFVDQMRNMHKTIIAGVGEKIDYLTLNSKAINNGIKKVMANDTYRTNMRLRSKRFRDRPMKPLDAAVWWVEYVLRDSNPMHLKSPTVNMNYFVINSVDFIFTLLLSLLMLLILLLFIFLRKTAKVIIRKKLD